MNYLPFNSVDHDRVYKAEDWAWYFSTFIGNGVFPKPTNGLMVVANGDMDVAVKAGFGFINGYAFRNQDDHVITIDVGDGSLDRIDRIVLRWDLTNRQMVIDWKKGTPSSSPEAPALVRTADTYELALADISVTRGLTTITQSHITDRRTDTTLCGIVEGTVSQIDWATLTAQLDAFMAEYSTAIVADYNDYVEQIEDFESDFEADATAWMDDEQADFEAWVASMHDVLDTETATHLLNLIQILQAQIGVPDAYDPDTSYQPKQYCIYNNKLEKCIKATSGGAFDQLFWRETTVLDEIDLSIRDAKDEVYEEIAKGSLGIGSNLILNADGDRLIVNTDDRLVVHQTVKFNFA